MMDYDVAAGEDDEQVDDGDASGSGLMARESSTPGLHGILTSSSDDFLTTRSNELTMMPTILEHGDDDDNIG